MTVANLEVYDALIDVGVTPEKARRAAEAVGAPHVMAAAQDARLGKIETQIAILQTDVATLKTDVATLKTDVATLKTDVAILKTDMAAVKVDLATLRGEVANLKWMVLFHGGLTLVVLGKLFALF